MGTLGGKREGAGRKPGSKSKATLEKEEILAVVREKIMRRAERIVDSQTSLALGQQFLYKIEKVRKKGTKGGTTYERQKPELVTSQLEIEAYLDGLTKEGDINNENDPAATYYYLTTKEPNNQAIDSMMNRAFGKPVETMEIKQDVNLKLDV